MFIFVLGKICNEFGRDKCWRKKSLYFPNVTNKHDKVFIIECVKNNNKGIQGPVIEESVKDKDVMLKVLVE